jgi:protein-tyrosine phosphatase
LIDAFSAFTNAYNQDEKVVFHCGGGKGRTGMVAYGTLMALGLAQSLNDAEEQAKSIRPCLKH